MGMQAVSERNVSKRPGFIIDLHGSWDLAVEDIWPDGDAPENPTAEMVAQRMRDYGPMMFTLREWCLEPQEVTVYGNCQIAEVWVS